MLCSSRLVLVNISKIYALMELTEKWKTLFSVYDLYLCVKLSFTWISFYIKDKML